VGYEPISRERFPNMDVDGSLEALRPTAVQDCRGGSVDAGGRGLPSDAAWCRGPRLNFRDFRAGRAMNPLPSTITFLA